MVDHDEYRRWRSEADGALSMARLGDRHNWRCFLAEQAAQMALKALLHGLGAGPWGHDVIRLGASLADVVDQPLSPDLDEALRRLSDLYIPARYPDAHPERRPGDRYTAADAERALADAELVLGTVDDLWAQLAR